MINVEAIENIYETKLIASFMKVRSKLTKGLTECCLNGTGLLVTVFNTSLVRSLDLSNNEWAQEKVMEGTEIPEVGEEGHYT